MALIRWNDPFNNMGMQNPFDDLLNGVWGTAFPAATHGAPVMDVYTEDDTSLIAEVQLPGFKKDDVEVHVHDGILEIKGEKHEKEENKDTKRNYMMRESHESFYRSIRLPKVADGDNVTAQFANGMLKVTVPFKELPKPKKVAISEGAKKK
ncbi:MAG TPA: Hsp20/alpha crystallin family protein [Candidatus Saccharimonadales bacterium]|nr:Hsp20/alpha crystallin family protein [Candidatus Saccharimonadales bacterium]